MQEMPFEIAAFQMAQKNKSRGMTLSESYANLGQNQRPYQQPTYYIPNNNKVAFARLTTVASALAIQTIVWTWTFSCERTRRSVATRVSVAIRIAASSRVTFYI